MDKHYLTPLFQPESIAVFAGNHEDPDSQIAHARTLCAALTGPRVSGIDLLPRLQRAGIKGVSKGQTEAASALGLQPSTTTRLVVVPQAMRIIIPPTGNQFIAMLIDQRELCHRVALSAESFSLACDFRALNDFCY